MSKLTQYVRHLAVVAIATLAAHCAWAVDGVISINMGRDTRSFSSTSPDQNTLAGDIPVADWIVCSENNGVHGTTTKDDVTVAWDIPSRPGDSCDTRDLPIADTCIYFKGGLCRGNRAGADYSISVSGIAFANYKAYIYFTWDKSEDGTNPYPAVTINDGTSYYVSNGALAEGDSKWGTGPDTTVGYTAPELWNNAMLIEGLSGSTLKLSGNCAKGAIAAIQIVKTIGVGDSAIWSNLDSTASAATHFSKGTGSLTLHLNPTAECPVGTKVAITAIKIANGNKTMADTMTINGVNGTKKSTTETFTSKSTDLHNTTIDRLFIYEFATPVVVVVGDDYPITMNSSQFSAVQDADSPIKIAGLDSNWSNHNGYCSIETTIRSFPGSACTATLNADTTFASISYDDSKTPTATTPVELTIDGNVTVTVDAAAEIASLKLKGSGNFTLTGSAMLTLEAIDATGLTGSVTLDAGTAIPTAATVKAGSAALVYNYSGNEAINLTNLSFSGNFTKGGTGTANLNKDIASGTTVTVAAGTLNYTNGSGNRGFKGNLVVQKDATFVSQKGDIMYWDSPTTTTIDVYGTIDLARTRWTMNKNQINIYAGGRIIGHNVASEIDSGNAANINYIAAQTIYMKEGGTGTSAEISAVIGPQGGATTFDVAEGLTLVLSEADSCNHSYRRGAFAKSGAGTLKITGNYKTLDGFSASAGTVTVTNTAQLPSTNGQTGSTIGAGATLDLSEVTDAAGTIFNAKLTLASGAKLKFAADTPENTAIPLHAASIVPPASKVTDATIIVGDTEKTATLFFDALTKTVSYTTEALATEYALTEADKTAITTGCTANGQVFKLVPGTTSFAETATITGVPEGYVAWTEGGAIIYAAKKTNSISIKINPRSATEGTIAKTDANVGGFPVAGVFWNHTKIFNDNNNGTTEILKVKDGNGTTLEDTRVFYYMPNSYFVGGRNKQTTGNGKLTYSYFDDTARIGSPTFPYVISQDGFADCELPTTPAGKLHWEIGISGMPYQVFDLYIYQASDQTASTISLLPIAVKANDGEWKYFAGDGQGSTIAATESSRWNGAAYCDAETMTEGTNYIRYRLSPAALGLEAGQRIEKIYLSHPNVSNGRLGLAGIQLVQVDNDGFYSRKADEGEMTAEAKYWTAEGSWKNSTGTAIDWPTDGGTAYVSIDADEVAEITINNQIKADLVTVKNAEPAEGVVKSFKFLTTESLDHVATVDPTAPILNAPVDATGFHGNLYLQGRIGGQVSLNSGVTVNFVSDVAEAETTAYPYTFAGTINPIKKNGPGSFLVPSSMYKDPFNVLEGAIRYDNAEAATASGALSGTGKAVKTGAGTLSFSSNNLPTGGLEIREGTIKLAKSSGSYQFWDNDARAVSIADGATLDINGYEGFKADITMAQGATLASDDADRDLGSGNASLHAIALSGNATARAVGDFGLLANGYNATTLELNGNTLTKTGAGNFFFCNTTSTTAGTIAVSEGALSTVNNYDVSFPNVDVTLAAGTTLSISKALTLKSVAVNGAVTFTGNGKLTAAMTFASGASITSTRELDTTGMTAPTGFAIHKETATEEETTSYVYTLVRTIPAEVTLTHFTNRTYTLNGEPTTLIDGDTIIIPANCEGNEWGPDTTDLATHALKVQKSMNLKTTIKNVTIDGANVVVYAYNVSSLVDGAVVTGTGSLHVCDKVNVNGSVTISCSLLWDDPNDSSYKGALKIANGAELTIAEQTADHVISGVVGKVPAYADGKYTLVTATYAVKVPTVANATVTAEGYTVDADGYITVNHGATVTFTVNPNTGYNIGSTNTITVSNVTAAVETVETTGIEVSKNTYTITITTVENTTVTVNGEAYTESTVTVEYGDDVTIVYTAEEGYVLKGKGTFELTNVTENATVGDELTTEEDTPDAPTASVATLTEGVPADLQSAYVFTTVEPSEKTAEYYDLYNANFEVSFDKPVVAGTILLKGAYSAWESGAWVEMPMTSDLAADEVWTLLPENQVQYRDVLAIGEFMCGVANLDAANNGTVMTVKLVLTNGEDRLEIVTKTYALVEPLPQGPTKIDEVTTENVADVIPETVTTAETDALVEWIQKTSGITTVEGLKDINVNALIFNCSNESAPAVNDKNAEAAAADAILADLASKVDLTTLTTGELSADTLAKLSKQYPMAKIELKEVTKDVAGEGATSTHLFKLSIELK